MKEAFTGAALDAPWVGTGGLLLLGVQVEWWIAVLALAYGLIRLISAGIDLHWKFLSNLSLFQRDHHRFSGFGVVAHHHSRLRALSLLAGLRC